MKMRISRTSVNSNAVNSEQVFVKGDEGGNSCIQSDSYMIGVGRKQVVLPHQSEGKVFGALGSGQINGAAVYFRFNDFHFVHRSLKDMWRTTQNILPPLSCSSRLAYQSLPQDVKSDFVVSKVADNTHNFLRLQSPKEHLAFKMKRVSVVPASDDEGRIQVNDGFKGVTEVSPFCHFASTPSLAIVPQANQGLRCFLCQLSVPMLPSIAVSSLPLADRSNLFVSALPEFLAANLQAFSASLTSLAPPAEKYNAIRKSNRHIDCDAVNSEQIFVEGDEGGNSCVQSNGYMVSIGGKQVVLPHQSEGKVTDIFSYGQSDCPSFQIGSDGFHPVHGFLKNMWSDPQDILPSLPCPSCLTHQSLPQDVKGDLVVNEIAHNANHSFCLQPVKKVSALKVEGIAPIAMSDDEGRIQVNDGFKGVMEVSPFCHFASTPSPAIVPQANQGLCQDNQPTPPEPLSTAVSSLPLAGRSNLFVSALPELLVANLQAFSASLPSFAPPVKKHSTLSHLGWHVDCDTVNSEQVFVKGDEGGNSCIQSDGYMIGVSGKQVVLPHQSEGKVMCGFGHGQQYSSALQFGSDDFNLIHCCLEDMWLISQHIAPPLPRSARLAQKFPVDDVKCELVISEITHNAHNSLRHQPLRKSHTFVVERVVYVPTSDNERCVPVNDGFKGFVEVSSLAQASSTPFHGKVLQANRVRSQPYLLTAHLLPSTAVSSLPLAGRSNLFVSALPEFLVANLQAFSASLTSLAPPAKKHNADVKAMKEAN
jgi:hypothetical protein